MLISNDSPLLLCRCGNVSSNQVSQAPMTSQTDEEEEEIRKHLSLPLSPGGDITVECVAFNHVGQSRKVFGFRESQRRNTFLGEPGMNILFCC